MASTFTTSSGQVLIVPDSSVDTVVVTNPAGLATSGIVTIVGEANEGNSYLQDKAEGLKLASNSYRPADINKVIAKYGSGNIVDAFRGASAPSASSRIQGGPNRILIAKVNSSTKASLATQDGHGTFTAKRGGNPGNQIQEEIVSSQIEVAPSTGSTSYVPSSSASALALRVNGGAKQTQSISANMSPSALAAAMTGLTNISAVGGANRVITQGLTSSDTIALAVISGQNVSISLATPDIFANSPAVGDVLSIPAGSVIEGVSAVNVGWYLVTSLANTASLASITATKVTAGAPAAVTAIAFAATPANDIVGYSSMKIDNVSGTDRAVLTGLNGQNIIVTVAGAQLTATLASGQVFAVKARVGDIMHIPSGSPYQGAGSSNVGWYQVIESSNLTSSAYVKASRLSNGLPSAVSSLPITGSSNIQILDKQIKGIGKTLEINDNAGAVSISTVFKQLGVNAAAGWIGELLTSDSERKIKISLKRSSTGSSETFSNIGGNVILMMGYHGTSATATISKVSGVKTLTTSVVGGTGSNLSINLDQLSSMNDLVTSINSNSGYSASVSSALDGGRPTSVLDEETLSMASDNVASQPGQVKRDIYDMTASQTAPSLLSSLASYSPTATAGLPENSVYAFFAGGLKGASSGLDFANAIDALQGVRCNFVVPLVSQDASLDIVAGKTEPGSTYTVDGVNAGVRTHVIAMSQPKIKRHRIGIVSNRGTFEDAKDAASSMANFRIAMLFQDVFDVNSAGDIGQFQPWMGSVKAAAMQAAGAYKAIFNKTINMNKAIQAAGDFDDENVTDLEDAILAGLIPMGRQETGGYTFSTDQTTYGLDNNIIYNSIQAVYVADLMALSLAQSLKNAFVGESVADVTTSSAISFIKGKLAEFLAAKFTVGVKGAEGGWKSIDVQINGNVMEVNVDVIEATALKFIPIQLSIEGIKASASA